MPYGPPLYGIFWGHIFCKYGGWGWSELFSKRPFRTKNAATPSEGGVTKSRSVTFWVLAGAFFLGCGVGDLRKQVCLSPKLRIMQSFWAKCDKNNCTTHSRKCCELVFMHNVPFVTETSKHCWDTPTIGWAGFSKLGLIFSHFSFEVRAR